MFYCTIELLSFERVEATVERVRRCQKIIKNDTYNVYAMMILVLGVRLKKRYEIGLKLLKHARPIDRHWIFELTTVVYDRRFNGRRE